VTTSGASLSADHRYTIGSSCAHCISRRSDIVGCQRRCLTGACWIRIVLRASLLRSHIQIVVGVESSRVATSVPSALEVVKDIPSLGVGSLGAEETLGGETGCTVAE
jgi:hypothetical protein